MRLNEDDKTKLNESRILVEFISIIQLSQIHGNLLILLNDGSHFLQLKFDRGLITNFDVNLQINIY